MNISKNDMTLYLVTDRRWLKKGENCRRIMRKLCMPGGTFFAERLSDKEKTYEEKSIWY